MTRVRQFAFVLLALLAGLQSQAALPDRHQVIDAGDSLLHAYLHPLYPGGNDGPRRLLAAGRSSEGSTNTDETGLAGGMTTAGESIMDLMGATLFEINETPVTPMGLLRVTLILTIAFWLSRAIRRTIARVGERRGGLNKSSLYTFGRLIHYVVLTIGIIVGLSSIGIDFTKFAMFASALGVGVGFGLQTLISNFVAGLIILFEKSLKVGDFVELESGVTGEVKEINMRSTLITTNDNIDILVPNAEFVGGRVTNWTLRDVYRRIKIPFGVAYGTDKAMVKAAALDAAENVPWTLKNDPAREPQVWFVEFGDSSLNFELVVWLTQEAVKRPGAVSAAYLWELDTKLNEYAIEIPFPQRDLHLRSAFGLKGDAARGLLERRDPQPPGPAGDEPMQG
jgi:small-conductance mechanosensitive channel